MRQICLDTETTGMDAQDGDRIIEIGCVEFAGRTLSDDNTKHFHCYINPEREIPEEVVRIHGLTNAFLADKPVFSAVVDQFLDFVRGAELIIHNAEFDIGFINAELARLKKGQIEDYCPKVTDTLAIAKKIFPGLRNNLDVLCSRYEIDNSSRTLHGALLDAQLLAEVYLAMTRKQESLLATLTGEDDVPEPLPPAEAFIVAHATPEELAEHEAFLDRIEKKNKVACLWRKPPEAPEDGNTAKES